jgi:phospholipase A1
MWLVWALVVAAPQVRAQTSAQSAGADCRTIRNDLDRLACYDLASGQESSPEISVPVAAPVLPATQQPRLDPDALRQRSSRSTLTSRWDLDGGGADDGLFVPRIYKPVYLMAAMYTDHVNRAPSSPGVGTSVSSPVDLSATEAKFQFSLKTQVARDLFGSRVALWAGYTQSSRWQAFNAALSRPFRETNYEPELMLVLPTDYQIFGFTGRMAGLSFNHQSNGRSLPLSRSWNRVIAQVGLEREDWLLMLRPWWRLGASAAKDNNPDIEDHLGRGEVLIAHRWQGQVFSLLARHTLRGGSRSRGSVEFGWSVPIVGSLKLQVQVFSGYGESLIDYNLRQTRLGIGLAMIDWL